MSYPPYGYPGGYPGYPQPPSAHPPPYYGGGYPAAPSFPAAPAYFFIRSRLNGLVLDIEGGNRSPGARVIMWKQKPTGDVDNQLWYDHLETGTIRVKLNDFCLTADGQNIVVRPFVYGDSSQQWVRADPYIQHRHAPSRVIDIANGNTKAGAHLLSWDRNGGQNQMFDFHMMAPPVHAAPLPPPVYPTPRRLFYIASEMHGKVLDINGGSTAAGANVIVWPRKNDGSRNQLWYFDNEGVIRSALHDFALEAAFEGADVVMRPYVGSPHQRWTLNGRAIMKSQHECLDIRGGDRKDGAHIILYPYKSSANQHWRLDYV